jgi:hypothetical protein
VIKKIWYPKKKVISCRLKKYSLSFKDYSARKEGKRNNRFLSLYDYNFLLVIEKIFSVNSKICGSILKKPFTVSEKRFTPTDRRFFLLKVLPHKRFLTSIS